MSIEEIDAELARFQPYGQEIAEEIEAAERRKEELSVGELWGAPPPMRV